jgi:1-acyl-sn-glycerol-3-phosphate acyltransferase
MTDAGPIESSVTPLIRSVALAGRLFAQAMTRVRLEGDIDAIPSEGPVILASNHVSNLDGVVLGAWLVPAFTRRINMLGKNEMFDWPVVGWVARNGGVHPVDRDGADIEAFRLAERILGEGHVLLIFPEGTRSRDGRLQKARDGLAMLALRTGAPIVPIGVGDSDRVWPRGQKLPRPRPGGRVTVRLGAPFRLADELPAGVDRKTAKGLATDLIMRRIAELLPPRQRGAYDAGSVPGFVPDPDGP